MSAVKAPFPWFGGKSRVAAEVWARFGDVQNYVEPFAGSLAVLLGRPHAPKTETVNDLDCYLANFWRAVQADPSEVARWADWPVNEADLDARHAWLVGRRDALRDSMHAAPEFFDSKIAGWWLWGICSWIGSGFCSGDGPWRIEDGRLAKVGDAGRGIHRQLPHLGSAGRGIEEWMLQLAARLRRVRVACGEWDRVLGESVTLKHGMTGVFLDPPYSSDEHAVDYSAGTGDVAAAVRGWALANGDNPALRIALCGYDGEHEMPGWSAFAWKAKGGYGSQGEGRGRDNAKRERIWFSPHCIKPLSLFGEEAA